MSLYCMNCKKFVKTTNKKCECDIDSLISVTENMIPVANILDGLGLQVASAFCLTEIHRESTSVEASVYFKCTYPEVLLQDLPNTWYWTDYVTLEHKVLCSCLSYEAEYVDTGAMSLEEFVDGVINDLIRYLDTRNKDGLKAVLTLLES